MEQESLPVLVCVCYGQQFLHTEATANNKAFCMVELAWPILNSFHKEVTVNANSSFLQRDYERMTLSPLQILEFFSLGGKNKNQAFIFLIVYNIFTEQGLM